MADYYHLIARAVESLEENTELNRRAIYDLARSAMLVQLRSIEPALSVSDIDREQVALGDAIRRVEAEACEPQRNGAPPSASRAEVSPQSTRPIIDYDQPADAAGEDDLAQSDLDDWSISPYRARQLSARPLFARGSALFAQGLFALGRGLERNLAAGAIVVAVVVLAAALGPSITASLRGPSDGTTGMASDRTALSKLIDRVSSEPLGSSSPGADVSAPQRVAFYEEDQADPAGKQYRGTVVWRIDSVAPSPGLTPHIAIHADIEIPERHISLRWSLRSNDDDALPASHTVELMFKLPPDDPHGGIAGIPGVLMKTTESTPGDQLAGIGVKAAPNLFLLSLSAAEADMQRNVQLLKERPWFDIPVAFDDGRRAIIAIEKGPPGERAFAEAFAAWEQ
jgi:hypothetical protein